MVEIWRWPVAAIPAKPSRESKGGQYAQWIAELREINSLISGYGRPAIQACVKPCASLTVSHPSAIKWALPGEIGKLSKPATSPAPLDTPLTRAEGTFVPGPRPPRRSQPSA